MNIHESAENYLERILMLRERLGYARSVDIATELQVTKPSVCIAMKRLRENNYIEMDNDGLITLTPEGLAIAERIYDRHKVLTSFFCLKSARLRRIISGRPMIIIHNGKIDQKEMRELRFSADDLMTQLRQNGIFRVEEVEFAVVETNGKLSVYQKYQSRTVTPQTLSMPDRPEDNAPPLAVVCEGTIMNEALRRSGRDLNWVKKQAAARKLLVEEVYLMVACPDGSCDIIAKERDR